MASPYFDTDTPVGRCIYCGLVDTELHDEHAIPFGLGGKWVLKDASCSPCGAITSAFEMKVLRDGLGDVRAFLGLRTRRPKQRPTAFPTRVMTKGEEQILDLPIDRRPVAISFPTFEAETLPRRLPGRMVVYTRVLSRDGWFGIEDLEKRLNVDAVAVTARIHPIAWQKLIAKVAYCSVIGIGGLEGLNQCFLLPGLLSNDDQVTRWVGNFGYAPNESATPFERDGKTIRARVEMFGSRGELADEHSERGLKRFVDARSEQRLTSKGNHAIQVGAKPGELTIYNKHTSSTETVKTQFAYARVRMFANLKAPEYTVLVGTASRHFVDLLRERGDRNLAQGATV